jgi:hypothetical protein
MKIRFWLTVLLTCSTFASLAQNNYCDDLRSDTDKVKNTVTVRSPELNIILKRVRNSGNEQFWINFNVTHLSEFVIEEGGLFVRFDNNKTLKYFGQSIKHHFISNRDGYYYETDLPLNSDAFLLFKTQKIVKFQIAGIDVPVTDELAVLISAYAVCLNGTN